MRYQSLVLAVTVATAVASPVAQLSKREEKTWDEHGNIKLTFSKETVNLGTIPIDDIAGKLFEVCHETGQCETNDIELNGQILGAETANNIKLTLGPSGAYPTWIRNGLLDSLMAAVKAMANCKTTTFKATCPNPMVFCPTTSKQVTQCEVPKFWGVNYQDPSVSNAAPPNIATDLEVEPAEGTICQDALGNLGVVAGAVNGFAGGFFSLLTLACT